MRQVKALFDRLSYANVIATLALFAALGGASYAAIVLPANSVGPRQLRRGAVKPPALGFPLGVEGVTSQSPVDLAKRPGCNAPMPPGQVNNVACPQPVVGASASAHMVHVHLSSTGRLSISGVVGLRDEGVSSTTADVTLYVVVDGRTVGHTDSTLIGGETVQVPIQAVVNISRGQHTVGVGMSAQYLTSEPGDVTVSPVSVTVATFPPS
jgi:hypothetical protein